MAHASYPPRDVRNHSPYCSSERLFWAVLSNIKTPLTQYYQRNAKAASPQSMFNFLPLKAESLVPSLPPDTSRMLGSLRNSQRSHHQIPFVSGQPAFSSKPNSTVTRIASIKVSMRGISALSCSLKSQRDQLVNRLMQGRKTGLSPPHRMQDWSMYLVSIGHCRESAKKILA